MRKIEYFCQNLQHSHSIQEQLEEAQKGGIIKSYTLTTLSAMNARRDADICLWCDEVWAADHIHNCLFVPDHNCMFTCGQGFEVFAFVKVTKEGFKPMPMNDSQDEVIDYCANNLFDEMCDPNSHISTNSVSKTSAHHVFDEMPEPILSLKRDIDALVVAETSLVYNPVPKHDVTGSQFIVVDHLQDVIKSALKEFDETPVPDFMLEMAQIESPPVSLVFAVDLPSNLLDVIDAPPSSHGCPRPHIDSLPRKMIICESYHLHQNEDELCVGDLCFKVADPRVQGKVFDAPNALHCLSFVNLVRRPLRFNVLAVVMSSILWIGINDFQTKAFESENDRVSFFDFKEVHSWGYPSPYCEFAMATSSLSALYSDFYVDSEMILLLSKCWKLFAFHLSSCLGETMTNETHAPNTPLVFVMFDPSRLEGEGETASLFFTYTLEDKGDFRGKEDRVYAEHSWKLFNVVPSWYNCIPLVAIEINEASFIPCQRSITVPCLASPHECSFYQIELSVCTSYSTYYVITFFLILAFVDNFISLWLMWTDVARVDMVFDPGGTDSISRVMRVDSYLTYTSVSALSLNMKLAVFVSSTFNQWNKLMYAKLSLGPHVHRYSSVIKEYMVRICHFDHKGSVIELAIVMSSASNLTGIAFGSCFTQCLLCNSIGNSKVPLYYIWDCKSDEVKFIWKFVYMDKDMVQARFICVPVICSNIIMLDLRICNLKGRHWRVSSDGYYSGIVIGSLIDECAYYRNRDNWEDIKLIYADTHVLVFDPGGNDEFMAVTRNIFAGDSYSFGLHGGKMDLIFLHLGREIQGNDTIFIFDPGGQALNEVVRLLTYCIRNVLVSIIGALRLKLFMCANFDP